MLTFVMVWAYFSFSQWLIIWAGNLPDEITWFTRRLNGGWQCVGLFLVVFHFAIPFVLLLSRPLKRNPRTWSGLAVLDDLHAVRRLVLVHRADIASNLHLTALTWWFPSRIGGLWLALFLPQPEIAAASGFYDDPQSSSIWSRHMTEDTSTIMITTEQKSASSART